MSGAWRSQSGGAGVNTLGGTSDRWVVMMMLLLLAHHWSGLSVGSWQLDARWGVACAIVDVVSTGLSYTGLSELAVILIDCGLHLLQKSIDGSQITTRLGIAHGWQAVTLHWIVAVVTTNTARDSGNGLIGWDG